MNGLLQQLERLSSETVSHHLQRPKEKICSSSVTRTIKAEGHMFDDSDHMISELTEVQHKGALLLNGSVDSCSSDHIRLTKEAIILNGTESFDSRRNKTNFLSDFEAHFGVIDASSTVSDNTNFEKQPNVGSSSDSMQFPQSSDSSDKLQLMSLQKTSDMLRVTDHPSPFSSPSDSAPLCDHIDVAHSDPNRTSQSFLSVPTHTRSLSQTASQLTNLIGRAESGNVGDASRVNDLFERSHVEVLSYKWGTTDLKGVHDTPSLDKTQCSPYDTSDLRTVEDPTTSTGHCTAPNISDMKEETAVESSPKHSQCCGEVPLSSRFQPEAEVSSLTHSPYPDWKLDRRASGHLFWRRDSSTLNGIDPSSRVKFRYDIEVREFESRNSESEDLADDDFDSLYDDDDDDDDDYDGELEVQGVSKHCVSTLKSVVSVKEESSSVGTSAFICVVAITAIVVMASYRWLLSALSLI
jgi:hypothetical protein